MTGLSEGLADPTMKNKPCLARRVGLLTVAVAGLLLGFSSVADSQTTAVGVVPERAPFPAPARIFLAANELDELLKESSESQELKGGDELLQGGDELLQDAGPDDLLKGSEDDLLKGSSGDELLDGSGDELLIDAPVSPEKAAESSPEEKIKDAGDEHAALFLEDRYPSANVCATCHPKQYREWSVSQHAYAQLSPIYMAMQMTINKLTNGTNGDFCIRCHNQVGMNLNESVYTSNLDRHPTSREGITCVVCHRVNKNYGKVSGRLALVEGDLYSTIYGPSGGKELERVLSLPQEYRVVTSADEPGRGIHTKAERFFELTKPAFCATCHDVTLLNGFRLEEAFAEYQQSPAADRNISCQDCHMGKVQGIPSGYDNGPAAMVGDSPTKPRKLTNHYFAGPDYSIIHPGIFPHNVRAAEFKTLREWLQFDHEAGWGTDAFEDNIPKGYAFPEAWEFIDDRYDARSILNEQFERLAWAEQMRMEVLRNGFKLGEIQVTRADSKGLEFQIEVRNGTDGHGVPTGFDAERVIFLEVTVTDRNGEIIYRSGDRDPNGDLRDSHSLYVHNGQLPLDGDLFSLQSKFIVRLLRGGEREQVLAVNTSVSALPFVRPERRATTLYGQPRGARKHKQTIEAGGKRLVSYSVPRKNMSGNGPYRINIRLISQMVPVNLIDAIQQVGFDYGMSPMEIATAVVNGASIVWEREAIAKISE